MTGLTPQQRALAEAMSEVSEAAFRAGWMEGTEYDVWRLLHHGGPWGMASAEQLVPLLADVRTALERAGCWIVWESDEPDERPVTLDQWQRLYRTWALRTWALRT